MCQIPRMCTFLLATRAGVLCGPRAPEAGSLLLLRGSYWSISTYLCADLSGGRCSLLWERWPGGLFFFLINLWIKLIVPAAQHDCICFPLSNPNVFSDTATHFVGWWGADDAGGE